MRKLSSFPPASQRLANAIASDHYYGLGDGDDRSPESIFETALTEDLEENNISASIDYEDMDEDYVVNQMREMAKQLHQEIKSHQQNIKDGMIIFAINDKLDLDVTVYDIDAFATLGKLQYATVKVDGEPFKLSKSDAKWIGVNDKTIVHEIDYDNSFMPKAEGEIVYEFGINGDYTFIVEKEKEYDSSMSY